MKEVKINLQVAMKAVLVGPGGKVLLLRDARPHVDPDKFHKYQCPGGRVEPGEQIEVALRREIREETGLEVEIGQPIFVGEWRPIIKGMPHQIIGAFFVCHSESEAIALSDEHQEYEWIEPADSANYEIMDPEDKAIARYYELLKTGKI